MLYPDNIQCICCGDEIMPNQRYSCCDSCLEKLTFVTGKACRICGVPLERTDGPDRCDGCISRESVLSGGLSVMTYEGEARKLVQAFKYRDKRYLVRPMAQMMYDLLQATYIDDFDVFIPVPVHFTRRWIRGFNHAGVLARQLSHISQIPAIEDLILRSKKTRRLAKLTHDQRAVELKGALRYNHQYGNFTGQCVAIIDDIFTTGATAEAMAEVLLRHGAGKVYIFTLCVTKES